MADIAPVIVDLEGLIENPGDSYPVSGRVEEGAYRVGEKEFSLSDGISYDVVFTNAGDGILVTGMVRASATGDCDRCLEPAHIDIAGEIEEYYLFEEPEDPEAYEDGFELVGEDRLIDLAAPIADAVVMDTPFVVLCRPECAGICPVCGANRNEHPCDCEAQAAQSKVDDPSNPFAALKDLKLDD